MIDVINDLDFQGSEALLPAALHAAERIRVLAHQARRLQVPIIYVNDNFGRWRSDFRSQVERCLQDDCPGRQLVLKLLPEESDYFVLQPMHSGFFSTALELLLRDLNISHLVLTGFATDLCVLYTANDAYMRGYRLSVPEDCVAAESKERQKFALAHMEGRLKAAVEASADGSLFEHAG